MCKMYYKISFSFVYFAHILLSTQCVALSGEKEDALRNFIDTLMACRNNVGMSISLVSNGTVFTDGFGYRNLYKKENMTADTKINIGSLTKSFTATLVADTVAKNLINWTTPLVDVLGPEFELEGPFRTEQACLADILAHRLGMPSYWGASTGGLNFTREELCMNRLRHFDALYDFRSEWLYSNYPYVLASYVTETLSGEPWEEHVTNLFEILGMNNTRHAAELTEEDWILNTANSYVYSKGEYIEIAEQDQLPFLEKISPAGGIFSTAKDMSKYMLFHLNGGKNEDGEEVIPETVLSEEYRSRNAISLPNAIRVPIYPVDDTTFTYGFGWKMGTYRGRRKVFHNGIYSGYNCLMTLLPDENMGIWICVNSPGGLNGSSSAELASFYGLDLMLGEEPWLNETTACTFPAPWESAMPATLFDDSQPEIALPEKCRERALSNDVYIGEYEHPGLGIFTVSQDDQSNLRCSFGLILKGSLNTSPVCNMFNLILEPPLDYSMTLYPTFSEGFPTYFVTSENSTIANGVYIPYFEMSLPPYFTRVSHFVFVKHYLSI